MKKCSGCEVLIDEKYSQCIKCLNKTKELNNTEETKVLLTHINWNLGSLQLLTRINLILNTAKEVGDKEMIEKIYKDLKKTYEKDISNIKKIKDEVEKVEKR